MNNNTLVIKELSRSPSEGPGDSLLFASGVNVIVGPPNTGKTKWLRMLDYLLGDDGKPEDIFDEDLATKYESVKGHLLLAGETITLERKWKEPGFRTKALINGESIQIKELWNYFMEKLEIPIVHYPQGNPYGLRAWPELNWRSLFRHVYRRQKYWNDFADRQPESEQHACLLQFLGLAARVFSTQYRDLIGKEKKIMELTVAKEQFISTLQDVSREVLDEKDIGVALTPQSIELATRRIQSEIDSLQTERETFISSLIDAAETGGRSNGHSIVADLGRELARLNDEQQSVLTSLQKTGTRLEELKAYRNLVSDEYSRMQRATQAGTILADLKITHCPACDREIQNTQEPGICYLCCRPLNDDDALKASSQRLEFELEQLNIELMEYEELISNLTVDVERLENERRRISQNIFSTEELLKPTRNAIAVILPPEIQITDTRIGRLQERLQQLERIRSSLGYREILSDQISKIQAAVDKLESEIAEQNSGIDFDHASDLISDGMNTYFNLIKFSNPRSWTQDAALARISDGGFSVKIGRNKWSTKLGGTLTLYFLFAYHYALLSLTTKAFCNYPGLVILDFPAELEDSTSVADKENFVIEPFIQLMQRKDMENTQLIAAGSAFENLDGANRIELTKIWK